MIRPRTSATSVQAGPPSSVRGHAARAHMHGTAFAALGPVSLPEGETLVVRGPAKICVREGLEPRTYWIGVARDGVLTGPLLYAPPQPVPIEQVAGYARLAVNRKVRAAGIVLLSALVIGYDELEATGWSTDWGPKVLVLPEFMLTEAERRTRLLLWSAITIGVLASVIALHESVAWGMRRWTARLAGWDPRRGYTRPSTDHSKA